MLRRRTPKPRSLEPGLDEELGRYLSLRRTGQTEQDAAYLALRQLGVNDKKARQLIDMKVRMFQR